MARRRDRIIALILAVVFFATSFAFSFAVIWQVVNGNKEDKVVQDTSDSGTDPIQQQLQGTQMPNFTPVAKIESLQVQDLQEGTGDAVPEGATVEVDYTGALASTGVVFESSLDSGQTATFGLDGVIPGWTQGIPGMKVGGTRRLLIPAALAYGDQSSAKIPANSDLVFDVTLKAIK
jgi:FKBP-type peptidyl-prolyl cis-trans isomerase